MTTSFYNGISGMKISQTGVDVISDNLSNVNTMGYKQQLVDFSTLFSTTMANYGSPVTSDVGYAATITSTTMDLSQGSLKQTDNLFDMSINGRGWLPVIDHEGNTAYTRTGSFVRDASGTLVMQGGQKLLVANPHNVISQGDKWVFNSKISTENLVDNAQLSPIQLPNDMEFPAQATKNIFLGGNLPNEHKAPNPKPAIGSSDFGVLYNQDAEDMSIRSGDEVAFGFGDNIHFDDGMVRYDICVNDDEQDGKNVNVDFDVNGENIKLTLPDGSTAKVITDAIAKALDEKGISYDKTDNSITLKDKNKLFVKSNGGDEVKNSAAMQRLVYNPDSNDDRNFTTMKDFTDDLQNMSDFTYGADNTLVGIDEKGRLYVQNNTDKELRATSSKTSNSNDAFINNLGQLGNIIRPRTASMSLAFNRNYQGFGSDIIDADGTKNDLKIDFYKTKITGNTTVWNATITETSPDGKVISTKSQDLTFDKGGALLDPTNITIDNNGTKANIDLGGGFKGITSLAKDNVGFVYDRDGFIKGNLENYDISDDGKIIATFSNGKQGILGQIPIFHFRNEQGLDSLGSNLYRPTDNSGGAYVFKGNDGSYIGGAYIKNHTLETSNVNMAQAMTELIIMQKSFDSNSKAITTSDQMIQKAIDMKR